jgi:formamidopyrimidine-DNA glycosylase
VPELPDIVLYLEALAPRVVDRRLLGVEVRSPFLMRSVEPPLHALHGRLVTGVQRLGKRIVVAFEGDLYAVLHLMIAGRLYWKPPGPLPRVRTTLAGFRFDEGLLVLTEAGSRRRASLTVISGAAALRALDPGGTDVLAADTAGYAEALRRETHTLKRALTDPRLFDGIGNAYSDEILHAAGLSPLALTTRLSDAEIERLHAATIRTVTSWIERLRAELGGRFPEKVTAFREGMAVHGRFGKPCPRCGHRVQRIRYADRDCNYCAVCQVGGRLLADRALSRLLREDWPKALEDLEELKETRRRPL